MEIIQQQTLAIPDIRVVRFGRHSDNRGYFAETLRRLAVGLDFLAGVRFEQSNESFSFGGVLRGLHSQAGQGKLVRLIYGQAVDFALDLRPESGTYRHIVGHELQSTCDYGEWIWLPAGFAHGLWLRQNSLVEYFCTAAYNPADETTVSFSSPAIQWELCQPAILTALSLADSRQEIRVKESDLVSTHPGF